MRTLQVIKTVQELADLFKKGKLKGCEVIHESNYTQLQGTDRFALSNELKNEDDKFLLELFKLVGIPVHLT